MLEEYDVKQVFNQTAWSFLIVSLWLDRYPLKLKGIVGSVTPGEYCPLRSSRDVCS